MPRIFVWMEAVPAFGADAASGRTRISEAASANSGSWIGTGRAARVSDVWA